MKNNEDLIQMIEKLKVCVDEGHDWMFEDSYSRVGLPSIIRWKCKCCGFQKKTEVTEEQELILMKYKTLKPAERAK